MNVREEMLSPDEAIDRALLIGSRELVCWMENNDDEATELALERGRLMNHTFETPSDKSALSDKIKELAKLQTKITFEAKRLHGAIRDELTALRGQSRRISSYSQAAKVTPISSRFVNRAG
ncbi:MAG: hypothetical protein EOM25_00150 [Deltaproteobacteria bacterium]|nr:hypothetical protein [Deltaproteobacteria bacterium]